MPEIRKLSACTLEQAVKAWNEGFAGYRFDATTTSEEFLKRLVNEELSPELSLVAFEKGEPVGIALGGSREFAGRKIAWNGGTAVARNSRGTGVGAQLIGAAAALFKEINVDTATLEALEDNHIAIRLYEKMGYVQTDELEHLVLNGPALQAYMVPSTDRYYIRHVHPAEIASLPFYKGLHPWQTQWQNARNGIAAVVKDEAGETVGYTYFNSYFNSSGKVTARVMLQCEAAPGHPDVFLILKLLTGAVFGDMQDDIKRTVPNLPKAGSILTGTLLKSLDFTPAVCQIYMTKLL